MLYSGGRNGYTSHGGAAVTREHPAYTHPAPALRRLGGLAVIAAWALALPWAVLPGWAGLGARYDAVILPPVLLGLYMLGGRLPEAQRRYWDVLLCLLPAALALGGIWQSAVSDQAVLAGLLPVSDASSYLADALRLGDGMPLTSLAVRRPLFTGAFGSLLSFCGGDLRLALAITAVLVGVCLFLATDALRRTHGRLAAGVLLVLLYCFARRYTGTVLSEQFGLAAGALAFAMLWMGGILRRPALFLPGMTVLALALNARAGAFFVLPALALWVGWRFGASWRGRTGWCVTACAFAALGFLVNALAFRLLVAEGALPFSNFGHVLYSTLAGAETWRFALQQHPDLAALPEPEQARRLYAMSWELVRSDPTRLFTGAARALTDAVVGIRNTLFSFVLIRSPQGSPIIDLLGAKGLAGLGDAWRTNAYQTLNILAAVGTVLLLDLLALAGVMRAALGRFGPAGSLALAALAGQAASLPFAPPWDADNMRVYAATIPLLALLPALALAPGQSVPEVAPEAAVTSRCTGLRTAALLLVLLCLPAPVLVLAGHTPTPGLSPDCPPGATPMVTRVHPGLTVRLRNDVAQGSVFDGRVTPEAIRANAHPLQRAYPDLAERLLALDAPTDITAVLDVRGNRFAAHVLTDPGAATNGPASACLVPQNQGFPRLVPHTGTSTLQEQTP